VSNLGDIRVSCRVPARLFPTEPDKSQNALQAATTAYEISANGSKKLVPSVGNSTITIAPFRQRSIFKGRANGSSLGSVRLQRWTEFLRISGQFARTVRGETKIPNFTDSSAATLLCQMGAGWSFCVPVLRQNSATDEFDPYNMLHDALCILFISNALTILPRDSLRGEKAEGVMVSLTAHEAGNGG
jgi:hypothetical protein